jgi:hypothetical protein
MSIPVQLGSGLVGAAAVTLINEIGHRIASESPRLDVLGMRALVRGYRAADEAPPEGPAVPLMALGGDLVANTLYYALAVGRRADRALVRGTAAGLAAGVAAALVGRRLGLNSRTGYHWGRTLALVGFYTAGGLAAAGVGWFFGKG